MEYAIVVLEHKQANIVLLDGIKFVLSELPNANNLRSRVRYVLWDLLLIVGNRSLMILNCDYPSR